MIADLAPDGQSGNLVQQANHPDSRALMQFRYFGTMCIPVYQLLSFFFFFREELSSTYYNVYNVRSADVVVVGSIKSY